MNVCAKNKIVIRKITSGIIIPAAVNVITMLRLYALRTTIGTYDFLINIYYKIKYLFISIER